MSTSTKNNLKELIDRNVATELYKAFPVEFAQNKNLSDSARALGFYIHSLPPDWIIRVFHMKSHFGWGRKKWDRVCGELRQEGYMQLTISRGGARLSFSIYKTFQEMKKGKVIHKPLYPFRHSALLDTVPKRVPLRDNNSNNRNNRVVTQQTIDKGDPVVDFEKISSVETKTLNHKEQTYLKKKITAMKRDKEIHPTVAGKSVGQLFEEAVFHIQNRNAMGITAKHAMNSACKMMREGKWGTPKGLLLQREQKTHKQ